MPACVCRSPQLDLAGLCNVLHLLIAGTPLEVVQTSAKRFAPKTQLRR